MCLFQTLPTAQMKTSGQCNCVVLLVDTNVSEGHAASLCFKRLNSSLLLLCKSITT